MNSRVTWLGVASSWAERAGRIGSTRPIPMKLTTQAKATAYTALGCRGMPARVEALTSSSCNTQPSREPVGGQNHDGNHIRSSHSARVSGSPVSTGRKKTKVAATTPT